MCGSASTTAGPTCRQRSGSASWRKWTGCSLCADDAEHRRSCFVSLVALPAGADRDRVMAELRAQGIGTAEYVPCVHLQPFMREQYGFREGMFPVAEDACSRTLALPFFTQIEAEDQERVVEALQASL